MESPQGFSKKFAQGASLSSSDFPTGLRPLGKSDDSREFPRAIFSRQPLWTFHCLYHFWVISAPDHVCHPVMCILMQDQTSLNYGVRKLHLLPNSNKQGQIGDSMILNNRYLLDSREPSLNQEIAVSSLLHSRAVQCNAHSYQVLLPFLRLHTEPR